jgi:hypothetical protein
MFPYTPYAYTLLAGPVENRRMPWVPRDIFADRNINVSDFSTTHLLLNREKMPPSNSVP